MRLFRLCGAARAREKSEKIHLAHDGNRGYRRQSVCERRGYRERSAEAKRDAPLYAESFDRFAGKCEEVVGRRCGSRADYGGCRGGGKKRTGRRNAPRHRGGFSEREPVDGIGGERPYAGFGFKRSAGYRGARGIRDGVRRARRVEGAAGTGRGLYHKRRHRLGSGSCSLGAGKSRARTLRHSGTGTGKTRDRQKEHFAPLRCGGNSKNSRRRAAIFCNRNSEGQLSRPGRRYSEFRRQMPALRARGYG